VSSSGRLIRVLIVDDSALMRKLLSDILRSSPDIEVAGTARDGREALDLAARLKPDVVTLDIDMPGGSGLEILPSLLEVGGAPVIMISTLTQEGAEATLTALERGAVDFLPKPDRHQVTQLMSARELILAKVFDAARSRVRPPRIDDPCVSPRPVAGGDAAWTRLRRSERATEAVPGPACVVIGISTGGPQALGFVLPRLKPPLPPILIVQHMPAAFTNVFAMRLNRNCAADVSEAVEGDLVEPGRILIAPGGRHMTVVGQPPHVRVCLSDGPLVSGHKPSVDMLFQSAIRIYRSGLLGVIMTGMGRDGVEGCKRIVAAGGTTFGQDEATSVVYGMNKAAFLEGAVQEQFPLDKLAEILSGLYAHARS
jgi:two-component system chemotaxis response regulator CheB